MCTAPQNTASIDDQRPLGFGQHGHGPGHQGWISPGASRVPAAIGQGLVLQPDFFLQDVLRKIHEGRPRHSRASLTKCDADIFSRSLRFVGGCTPLCDGAHEIQMVHFVKRTEFEIGHFTLAGQQNNRSRTEIAVGHTGHGVENPGTRNHPGHSGPARDPGISLGHEHGGLFMANIHNPYPLGGQCLIDTEGRHPAEGENDFYLLLFKRYCHQIASILRIHVALLMMTNTRNDLTFKDTN